MQFTKIIFTPLWNLPTPTIHVEAIGHFLTQLVNANAVVDVEFEEWTITFHNSPRKNAESCESCFVN